MRARFANRRVCDRLLGLGYDIAEKIGLLCDSARLGYHMQELRIVDDHRPRLSGFGVRVFRGLTGGRYITLVRSDLPKLIDDRISRSCEIIFGDSITSLRKAHGEVQSNSSIVVNATSISSSPRTVSLPRTRTRLCPAKSIREGSRLSGSCVRNRRVSATVRAHLPRP